MAASPDNTLLYVGSQFTQVNGQPYQHLVAFDLSTGQISSELPPTQISGTVKAITQVGSDLYIGGKPAARWTVRSPTTAPGQAPVPTTAAGWSIEFKLGRKHRRRRARPERRSTRRSCARRPGGWTTWTGKKGQMHLGVNLDRHRPNPAVGRSPQTSRSSTSPVYGTRLYAAMAGPGGAAYDARSGSRVWDCAGPTATCRRSPAVDGWPVFGMHGDYVAPRVNSKLSEYGKSTASRGTRCWCWLPTGTMPHRAPPLKTYQGVLGVWSLDASSAPFEVGSSFTKVDGSPQARFAIFPLVG